MSISEPITISYLWNRDNFEKSYEKAYAHHYRHSARRYIGWFFIALAQFGVVAALKEGRVGMLIFATVMLLYWYVLKPRLLKRRAIRAFESSPLKDRVIRLRVSEEGIEQEGEKISWDEVDGVEDLQGDLILYYGGKNFYIPRSGFDSPEAVSAFKRLAKSKGKLYV